jgi:glycosyltransferase involved in cell wall biosynthesis
MAADYLFTPSWRRWNGYTVATCAIDTSAFQATVDRSQLCKSFGISPRVRIVGHVGNFRYGNIKKHDFLLHIVAAMLGKREDIHLVLVGDGPLKPEIESLANKLGISDHVTFAGGRDDVPVLMKNLFDLLVLPSQYEGLPLVIMESQCAGLASLISDVITLEVTVIDELVERQSLKVGPEIWAERAFEILERPPYDKDKALMQIEKSKFGIASSVKFLSELYSGKLTS